MQTIQEFKSISGNFLVPENTIFELIGQLTGTITVPSGSVIKIYGQLTGQVKLGADSSLQLYGQLTGRVIGEGSFFKAEGSHFVKQ